MTVGDDSVSRVISLRLDEAQALAASPSGPAALAAVSLMRSGDGATDEPAERRARRAGRAGDAPTSPTPAEPEPAPTPTSRRAAPPAGARAAAGSAEPAARPAGQPASRPGRAEPRRRRSPPTLDAGLARTRGGFMSRLRGFLGGADDEAVWDDVEETLIAGDVGAALAMELVERARARRDPGGPEAAIRAELAALLVAARPRLDARARRSAAARRSSSSSASTAPARRRRSASSPAATRPRAGRSSSPPPTRSAPPPSTSSGSGPTAPASRSSPTPPAPIPGAVVYDALDAAVARGADLVIADTAGRLHTKSNLMDELAKIRRIIDKRLPGAEPETLFVLDATTGQNGLAQAKAFHEAVGLTGIVLTKLDSTAKGGIVFAIEDDLGVPVRFVGVGEKVGDLLPVRPRRVRGGALRLTGSARSDARRRRLTDGRRVARACATLRPPRCARTRAPPGSRRCPSPSGRSLPPRSPARTVFDTLSERLRKTLADLTGRGRISEADVDAAMREVRLALLEADVNFKVVKDFVGRVREQAVGAEVLESLTAGQQVVKIVNDELVALLSAPATGRSTSRATPPSSPSSASRARARRRRPPSSPGTSSSRAAGRCSSPPTRTGRPPPTSSRRSARPLDIPVYRAPGRHVRSSTSPAAASTPPSASRPRRRHPRHRRPPHDRRGR